MAEDETVFDVDDIKKIEELGQSKINQDGKRIISASTIHSVSSCATSSVDSGYSSLNEAYEIPNHVHSEDTYKFCGLSPDLAHRLWLDWSDIGPEDRELTGPIEFLDLAREYISCQEADLDSKDED